MYIPFPLHLITIFGCIGRLGEHDSTNTSSPQTREGLAGVHLGGRGAFPLNSDRLIKDNRSVNVVAQWQSAGGSSQRPWVRSPAAPPFFPFDVSKVYGQ